MEFEEYWGHECEDCSILDVSLTSCYHKWLLTDFIGVVHDSGGCRVVVEGA